MLKKKTLGQHFLHNKFYLGLVADTAELAKGETVLEVGPGDGALTEELLAREAHVVAVEKDHRLLPVLHEKFKREIEVGKLQLIEGDILTLKEQVIFPKKEPYKLVANIPYYITGALLEKFLSAEHQPTAMIVLVQKEVAERIARSKKESILSLSVKAFGHPFYIKTVPAGAFVPPPEVDSAILAIKEVSRGNFVTPKHEKAYFELLHAGFAHKRKLLKRNIEGILGPNAGESLISSGIPENARAEDIKLEKWLELATLETLPA
jgi:16S rRNA (adenine1518-N6/adenine1519-N6)-dimethyltransferase